jgi:cephalosporin hydroxylase
LKIKIPTETSEKEIDIYSEEGLKIVSELWTKVCCEHKIMYQPTWLGIPIIQFPTDIVMMQELIWKVRPDVIVETGVAHGGSAILYASILELIGKGYVIGVDIEIRSYNKVAIMSHPLSKRIRLIEGSSIDEEIVNQVKSMVKNSEKIMVVLDSNHSREHVYKEMLSYAPMVSDDSYLVTMDGTQAMVSDIPRGKKEWAEDNPLRAIEEFLEANSEWEVDPYYNRMLITSNPSGFLRRRPEY